jgi:hypothetical protein
VQHHFQKVVVGIAERLVGCFFFVVALFALLPNEEGRATGKASVVTMKLASSQASFMLAAKPASASRLSLR